MRFQTVYAKQVEKVKWNDFGEYLYTYDIFQEGRYISTSEIIASTSKEARKKLEVWKSSFIPEELYEEPDHIQEKNPYFTHWRDFKKIRISHVNQIIREKGEEMFKRCPMCDSKNHVENVRCINRDCDFLFFNREPYQRYFDISN